MKNSDFAMQLAMAQLNALRDSFASNLNQDSNAISTQFQVNNSVSRGGQYNSDYFRSKIEFLQDKQTGFQASIINEMNGLPGFTQAINISTWDIKRAEYEMHDQKMAVQINQMRQYKSGRAVAPQNTEQAFSNFMRNWNAEAVEIQAGFVEVAEKLISQGDYEHKSKAPEPDVVALQHSDESVESSINKDEIIKALLAQNQMLAKLLGASVGAPLEAEKAPEEIVELVGENHTD